MASILVVDDDDDIRFIFEKVLSRKYVVFSAPSGEQALKVFYEKDPDLVIMDSCLPDMDGIEVAGEMIGARPGANIVGATGFAEKTQEFLELGARKVLPKPFTIDELENAISEILD